MGSKQKDEGCKIVWVEKPSNGKECRYWKRNDEVFGKCTLPANRGAWCKACDWVSTRCPLPGWDYE